MAIISASLSKESQDRYLTYALSVVSSRALPDVRDGLKPVQRRILFAMLNNLGLRPNGTYRKSAAVVGEVLARFHPHSDVACYEALVRMAQDFSMRYPLIDGQGNFGSLDGDSAAAYRYTEAKLKELAIDVIGEIDQEAVQFRDNFDATMKEPIVLPSMVPNLLINGATGIAVGMATSIPPHNLRDVIKALLELSSDPNVSPTRLATVVKAPDFPTGCAICNSAKELADIYLTGRGQVRMRAEWCLEDAKRGKSFVVITAVPYAVDKSQLVEKIASLIIDRKLPQLIDVRDESTDQVRIVLEVANGVDPQLVMAYLFKHTNLESNFSVNLTALVPGKNNSLKPELLSLKDCLKYFLAFRAEVVNNRLLFEKRKLEERLHILTGLLKIFDALDEAIEIVRKSSGRADAASKLQRRFKLSETQAFAVVDMRIYQLSKTNINDIQREAKDKQKRVAEIERILKKKSAIEEIVRVDLKNIAEKYGDRRRCRLIKDWEDDQIELRQEDFVVNEDVFAIVSADGWIKRIRQTNELASTRLRDGDSIYKAFSLSTLDAVAFFTNLGALYHMKVADFPASGGYGSPIQKVLRFRDGEKIAECFGVRHKVSEQLEAFEDNAELMSVNERLFLLTERGMAGVYSVDDDISSIKKSGRRVMKIREGDNLVSVVKSASNLALFTKNGMGLAIKSNEIPQRAGVAVGVIAMGVATKDALVKAIGFSGKTCLELCLLDGVSKRINVSDMTKGKRGLKGKPLVKQGQIVAVKRV